MEKPQSYRSSQLLYRQEIPSLFFLPHSRLYISPTSMRSRWKCNGGVFSRVNYVKEILRSRRLILEFFSWVLWLRSFPCLSFIGFERCLLLDFQTMVYNALKAEGRYLSPGIFLVAMGSTAGLCLFFWAIWRVAWWLSGLCAAKMSKSTSKWIAWRHGVLPRRVGVSNL